MVESLQPETYRAATEIARLLRSLPEDQAELAFQQAIRDITGANQIAQDATGPNQTTAPTTRQRTQRPATTTTAPVAAPATSEGTTATTTTTETTASQEAKKSKLKKAVENKYVNFTRNSALPFLLMASPAARVGLEGLNKITNSFVEGKNGRAIKEMGYYTVRTLLAANTMGGSEIGFGVIKGIRSLMEKDADGKRRFKKGSGWGTIALATGVGIATWYCAPMLSNTLIGGLQNTPAIQGLEKFGEATKLFRPELTKSYANVASRMALNTFVSWTGKKAFKESSQAQAFEIARRTVTGVFALEAFGEGLYNSEGGILTGNRPIPFLGKTPFNLSQLAGDTFGKGSEDVRNWVNDQLHFADKTYTPHEPLQPAIPLEPKGGFETPHLNPDGTIDQVNHSTSEIHDQSEIVEVVPAHPISDEPIPNIEKIPGYTHTHTTSEETTLVSFAEDTSHAGHTSTDPLAHTSSTEFPVYKVDSNDASNLKNFIENPDSVTVPRQVITQPEAAPEHGSYKIGEMSLVHQDLSVNQIDQLPEFLLHHSQDIVDETGSRLIETSSPLLESEHTVNFAFSFKGDPISISIDMNAAHQAMQNNKTLSEYVLENSNRQLRISPEFFERPIFDPTVDTDAKDVYQVSILQQFATALQAEAGSTHVLPTEHAKGISDFGTKDDDITFYEELTARLHEDNPLQAEYLFERRLLPTADRSHFLYNQPLETVASTEGLNRINLITQGHADMIPKSEFKIIYDHATGKEGFLNTSNDYLGHLDRTTVIQLKDGTILSFGTNRDIVEYGQNHYVHDTNPNDSDGSDITDELEAQIREVNPHITQEKLDEMVVEASLKLAEIAETHNFSRHIEDIVRANPGVSIQIKADGDEILESFTLKFDPAKDKIMIGTSDHTTSIALPSNQLLIEFLSQEKFLTKSLSGLQFVGEPDRYEEALVALKDSILENPSVTNVPNYFSVNGSSPYLFETPAQVSLDDSSDFLSTIIGRTIIEKQGYMAHLDPRLLDPEVPEIKTSSHLYGKPDPDAMIDDIQRNIDAGNVKAYNPAQLVVLDEMGKFMIQSASREIAEAHFEDPKAFAEHPIVLHLPLSEAGYAKDYTIEVDGGPVNFEEMYTAIAKNINSNLREADIISGRYVDPSDHAFQVFVNQHIIDTLFPQLGAKGIDMEDIIDQNKLYFAIGDDQRLEIPISELKEANPTYDITREMIKLSLDHVVGRAENFDADGNPVLTPLGFSPSAQILQTTTGSIPGAIGHGFSTIGGGFLDLAASYKDALFGWLGNIAGNPATQNTIRGTVDFTSAAVQTGVPLAQYAANVAVGIPVETALETADVLNSLKYSLNSVNIGGFRPFTLFDPMLEKPLDTMDYLAGMNSGVYPYSVSGVINHVLSALNPEFPHLNGDYSLPDGIDHNTQVSSAIGHVAIAHDVQTYTVQSGDSLAKISRNIYGSEKYWPQLYEANRDVVEDPRKIFRGEVLKLPKINN